MYCSNCGTSLDNTHKFCGTCGKNNDLRIVNDYLESAEENITIDNDAQIYHEYFDYLVNCLSLDSSPSSFDSALQLYKTLLQYM